MLIPSLNSLIWGLEDYFKTQLAKQNEGRKSLNFEMKEGKTAMPPSVDHVRIVEREEDGQKVMEMPIQFIRGNFNNADLPKMLLNVSKIDSTMHQNIFC